MYICIRILRKVRVRASSAGEIALNLFRRFLDLVFQNALHFFCIFLTPPTPYFFARSLDGPTYQTTSQFSLNLSSTILIKNSLIDLY